MSRFPYLTDLADAVLADTNTAALTVAGTRENLPVVKLESLSTVVVKVVPMTTTWARQNRDDADRNYGVAISLEQRIDLTPAEDALTEDQLMNLAEDLATWWIDEHVDVSAYSTPGGDCVVSCVGAALNGDEPFDPELLREKRVFRAIISLQFRAL